MRACAAAMRGKGRERRGFLDRLREGRDWGGLGFEDFLSAWGSERSMFVADGKVIG